MMREMKDSGIEWIGKIPTNWDLTKLKTNFAYEKGKNAALYTKEYVGLHKGNYPVYSGQTEDGGIMGTIDTFDYDVDECVFSTTVGAKVMTPMLLSGKFSLSQNCLIMKPTGMYSCKMLYYCLDSLFDYERKLIPSYMQPSLRFSDLNKYCLPQPSIQEQEKIVDHLDKECARIDSLVEKQRSIIEKLKEYKKSVITEAVTHGLNSTAPMKDSGIEWIGKIPVNWEVCRIKNMASFINGYAFKSDELKIDKEIPVIRISDIQNGGIDYSTCLAFENDSSLDFYCVKARDIIIAMSGATTGKTAIVDSERKAFINQRVGIIRNAPKYVFYCLNTYRFTEYVNLISAGSAQPNISMGQIMNFVVPYISTEEQQVISNYLDQKCAEIDSVIEKREKMIELLTEYKKSLIYECVTGKKEVA